MDMGISGLRVAISGAASGIGLEMARAFVREGARVFIGDVDRNALDALKATDPEIASAPCDVADRAAASSWFDRCIDTLGGLDCLINNAGIAGPTANVETLDPEEWDRTLAVNISGQFNLTRLAVRHLRRSANASILNMSSAAGRLGFALRTPYAASKWAVVGFTKSLAKELGPDGVRANALLPGLVDGERIRKVFASKAAARGITADEQEAAALALVSMRKLVPTSELADMAVYLASPHGASISGQAISICGDLEALQ
ncbi:SDR family oxidoreductase [Rhodoligotrophos defluvii]|uniref:SDR family oxidoreductase n=1 Tax=Rhodoligotrophos defluvii TaxID=2561934 RepID=UPI0010C998BE|nr:SDR family oxidoreductase [Rhodoligotrophos defluvii]